MVLNFSSCPICAQVLLFILGNCTQDSFLISIAIVSTIVPALITSGLETASNPIHPLFMHSFNKILLTTYFIGNCRYSHSG